MIATAVIAMALETAPGIGLVIAQGTGQATATARPIARATALQIEAAPRRETGGIATGTIGIAGIETAGIATGTIGIAGIETVTVGLRATDARIIGADEPGIEVHGSDSGSTCCRDVTRGFTLAGCISTTAAARITAGTGVITVS